MLVIWKNGTLTTRIRVHHKVVYVTLRIILVVLNFLPREEYSVTNVISTNSLRFAHFCSFLMCLFYLSKELITKSPFPYFVLAKLLPVRLTHHKRLFFRYKYEMISL